MAAAEGTGAKPVLVVGAGGQLGRAVLEVLAGQAIPAHACDMVEGEGPACGIVRLDITDARACVDLVESVAPRAVINCAAYTAVDKAEEEPETADLVNRVGAANVARAAARAEAKIVHISTDFVFEGAKTEPYLEDDPAEPLSVYGKTKLAGEAAVQEAAPDHLILRTAWLFGPHGPNFVKTIIRAGQERDELNVVDDQIGSPTCALDLAAALAPILAKDLRGTFHLANQGRASWYDLAKKALELSRTKVRLNRIKSDALDRPAPRPAFSVLSLAKLAAQGIVTRPWEQALADCLNHKDWSL